METWFSAFAGKTAWQRRAGEICSVNPSAIPGLRSQKLIDFLVIFAYNAIDIYR
jgi:hypothetical protein